MWFSNDPNIVISDYDVFYDAFVTHGDALANRSKMPVADMYVGGRYGLIMCDGLFWHEQRRFSPHVLRDFGFGWYCIRSLKYALVRPQYNGGEDQRGG